MQIDVAPPRRFAGIEPHGFASDAHERARGERQQVKDTEGEQLGDLDGEKLHDFPLRARIFSNAATEAHINSTAIVDSLGCSHQVRIIRNKR
jgi:hypothetical protein